MAPNMSGRDDGAIVVCFFSRRANNFVSQVDPYITAWPISASKKWVLPASARLVLF